MDNITISVKQLNTYVKSLIEGDARLSDISVTGEISNFKNHYSSGHWYFTLKDNEAQIRCVMFAGFASRVGFEVSDGLKVALKGRVSLYERDGQYQFYAEKMEKSGVGDLSVAFELLKEKLKNEGLFDTAHKKPLVRFPKKIAVLTSDTGAAIRDILNILSKRYPLCEVLICPVAVQGESAAGSMIKMLDTVYHRDDIDTIIIGRGGGSLEDLWAFNDENLARKIFTSPIPVISAVGHETDFTICDFVADVRASTPSHAAELAVPDMHNLISALEVYDRKLINSLTSKYRLTKTRFELLFSKSRLSDPGAFFNEASLAIDGITEKIIDTTSRKMLDAGNALANQISRLDTLSPLKVISRGFAAVTDGDSRIVTAAQLV